MSCVADLDNTLFGRCPVLARVSPHKLEVNSSAAGSGCNNVPDFGGPALDMRQGMVDGSLLGPLFVGGPRILREGALVSRKQHSV